MRGLTQGGVALLYNSRPIYESIYIPVLDITLTKRALYIYFCFFKFVHANSSFVFRRNRAGGSRPPTLYVPVPATLFRGIEWLTAKGAVRVFRILMYIIQYYI